MWTVIGLIVGWIETAYDYVEHYIVAALVAAWHVLVAYLKLFGGFARGMWTDVIKPIGVWVDKAYERLKGLYDKVIGPYHAWIKRIVSVTRQIYDTFFRPILSAIDAVQKILKLLELLHLDFATKLDQELQLLEQKLVLPVQTVIQTINAIDNRIEAYILTVDNLFKSATLLRSFQRDVKQLLNIQWSKMFSGVTLQQRKGPPKAGDHVTADVQLQAMEDAFNGNEAASGVHADAGLALMEQMFAGSFSAVRTES